MMPPYEEDAAVCRLAERLGFGLQRRDRIEVTDEGLLEAAGLLRRVPDYAAIRKALLDGREVPGAKLGGVEYILRREQQ